ncbi:biosynthetic arginine decarboxylase [Sulfurimonas sp. HSL3-7]|uniref:biosynthetic arginine decarboxylase n=1 Tax=Sulfonitrofixus jiaomeiensis TaxID=3131938 RepID=UPI0031F9C7A3
MKDYGLGIWGNENFIIKEGEVCINRGSKPSLMEITQDIRNSGLRGPIILRFPHLIGKQIESLYANFERVIEENNYTGSFNAVFPLKVNQYPQAVKSIIKYGASYNYGLEAGSKAELVLAIAHTPIGSPITVNGFKDTEMTTLCFMAAQMGHNITITIEGLGELESIIEVANTSNLKAPNIGIRVRLHSSGSGSWAKSGGMDAKFGLTATELLEAITMLQEQQLIDHFTMIHFHIGSQMEDIAPLKKALREAGNIYAELKRMGSDALNSINIGGGLAVEYSQHEQHRLRNYSLKEFANDVVYVLREIMNAKGVEHPNIYTESGRFIIASHAILITPVLELFSQDYQEKSLKFSDTNAPLIEELRELNNLLKQENCIEYIHDALDHLESLFTLFDLGYITLQDRSNAEILVHQIIKKSLRMMKGSRTAELNRLQERLQERYLINSSIFQSMPDYWGLRQQFPVMPLNKLDEPAIRAASLWDITCDSDGEILFNPNAPLYLHDVDLDEEEYFLAFFNIGAYQETLGMSHNLFTHPSECSIEITEEGYELHDIEESDNILDILDDIGYDKSQILIQLKNNLANSPFTTEEEKSDTLQQLELYLYQNGYLRTTN